MARYGQLLIDAGGGIIDHQKQSKRQKGANVIIGLGGTGSDAVIKLKKEVYKQLQPDDLDATVPTYKGIKFLIVDSDDAKLNEQNGGISDIDRGNEYFDVSNKTIVATLKATDVLKNRHELDWMDYEQVYHDWKGSKFVADKLLKPEMTIKEGQIMYCAPDYFYEDWK